jgi:hypothetical protein
MCGICLVDLLQEALCVAQHLVVADDFQLLVLLLLGCGARLGHAVDHGCR